MTTFHHRRRGGKRLAKRSRTQSSAKGKLAALFLCLSMLVEIFPILALAEGTEEKFSELVNFDRITLHYADANGRPEGPMIQNGTCIEKSSQLALSYIYRITPEKCGKIKPDTPYYLEISPHLVPTNLMPTGSPLTIDMGEDEPEIEFGRIYANGSRAWVTFLGKDGSSVPGDLVLADHVEDLLGTLNFYLSCYRAGTVPKGETSIAGQVNRYAMKFEDGGELVFGYAENEPLTAKAQIDKQGGYKDKIITWEIDYTPWQNPDGEDNVILDTPFELRDTIRYQCTQLCREQRCNRWDSHNNLLYLA